MYQDAVHEISASTAEILGLVEGDQIDLKTANAIVQHETALLGVSLLFAKLNAQRTAAMVAKRKGVRRGYDAA